MGTSQDIVYLLIGPATQTQSNAGWMLHHGNEQTAQNRRAACIPLDGCEITAHLHHCAPSGLLCLDLATLLDGINYTQHPTTLSVQLGFLLH